MKKIVSICLALMMMLSLSACGAKKNVSKIEVGDGLKDFGLDETYYEDSVDASKMPKEFIKAFDSSDDEKPYYEWYRSEDKKEAMIDHTKEYAKRYGFGYAYEGTSSVMQCPMTYSTGYMMDNNTPYYMRLFSFEGDNAYTDIWEYDKVDEIKLEIVDTRCISHEATKK